MNRLPLILLLGVIAAACALVGATSAAAAVSTTTTITNVSNRSPAAGEAVTFTVSVVGSDNSAAGSGTVNIVDATRTWGSGDVSNGVATITVAGGFPGNSTLQVQAKFTGSGNWGKSSSSFVTISVGQTALPHTWVSLTPDRSKITSGDSVTFTIGVTDIDTGTTPSGIVTLEGSFNGGGFVPLFPTSQLDVSPENGAHGTITDQFNPAGTYRIRAEFQGSQYQPATSALITLVVDPAKATTTTTTTTVLANGGVISVTPTDDVTLVATVKQNVAISPPAGDYVNFFRQLNNSPNGYKEPLPPADITWDITDGSAPATGTATLETGSWPRGTYTVYAEFIGDQYDVASTGTSTLGVGGPEPTSTTYVGALTGTTGSPIALSGKLVDENGTPLTGELLTLSLNDTPSETCTGTTTNAGIATCSVTVIEGQGSYPVKASFAGDGDLQASSGGDTADISGPAVTAVPTNLPYQGAYTGIAGSTETLTFKLTDRFGNAVAGLPVVISVDGHPYPSTTTDANGLASLQLNLAAGTHAVGASFDGALVGTKQYQPSTGLGSIVVSKLPTTITYTGPASVNAGTQANVQFLLASGAQPLAGKTLAITVNGSTVSVTTDQNGLATLPESLAPGDYPISAAFDGTNDATYTGSNGAGDLVVLRIPTTTTGTVNPAVPYGATATLSATLVETASQLPIGGRTVILSFGTNGVDSCSGVTNAGGQVSCSTGPVQSKPSATPYVVTATFAGDTTYVDSSGTGSIVVTKADTATVDNISGNFLLGSSLTLSGTLTSGGQPVAGKTLTLTFGSASCPGVTDASGVATCSVIGGVPGPTGPVTPTATFAGDDYYNGSNGSSQALVYAFAPGGGNFVVGDLTATGSVYFWGSQWWKVNRLSAGDAQAVDPGAFKGYAALPANPQCGGTWSTDPGNSTPPPGGPLPAYMAVIVTSQNHKAPGKIVTGTIVHIVIVKTDAGYAGNPGHDGTGRVVTTIC